jgi:hypothetical protein
MPDNLTVEISANTQKFRYEVTKLQNDLKNLGKQLRDAVKAGDEAQGMRLSKSFEQTRASIARLNKELAIHQDVVKETGTTWAETGLKIKEAVAAFAALEGVRKFGEAFSETAKKISEVSDTAKLIGANANDVKILTAAIEDTGSTADGAKEAVAHLAQALADARANARAAGTAMEGGVNVMRGSIGAASDQMKAFNEMLSGVNVMRGGARPVMAVADAVDVLKERMGKFPATEAGARKAIEGLFDDLAKLRKADASLGTAVGIELLGKRYAAFAEGVDKLGNSKAWEEIRKGLAAKGLLISPDDQKNIDEYNEKMAELNRWFEALRKKATMPLFPTLNEGIDLLSKAIDQIGKLSEYYTKFKEISAVNAIEQNIVGPVRSGVDGALDALRAFGDSIPSLVGGAFKSAFGTDMPAILNDFVTRFSDAFKIIADLLKLSVDVVTGDFSRAFTDAGTLIVDTFNGIVTVITLIGDLLKGIGDVAISVGQTIASAFGAAFDAVKSAAGNISGALGSAIGAGAIIPGGASGGYVSGPGNGTSDSIPARLSNGEFVVRKAAVQRYGTGLFHALNAQRFADGGFVSPFLEHQNTYNGDQKMSSALFDMSDALSAALEGVGDAIDRIRNLAGTANDATTLMTKIGRSLKNDGMATGGMVPGSGNGDTVPAWLTPGEYVMRKSAVARYGMGLFHALNAERFALGGIVDGLHAPRGFADGGLVGAAVGGGTPVHLHLGGQTFALTGGADVVSSLAHEARRYQLRSAGTKPSWYGGTPGGR